MYKLLALIVSFSVINGMQVNVSDNDNKKFTLQAGQVYIKHEVIQTDQGFKPYCLPSDDVAEYLVYVSNSKISDQAEQALNNKENFFIADFAKNTLTVFDADIIGLSCLEFLCNCENGYLKRTIQLFTK